MNKKRKLNEGIEFQIDKTKWHSFHVPLINSLDYTYRFFYNCPKFFSFSRTCSVTIMRYAPKSKDWNIKTHYRYTGTNGTVCIPYGTTGGYNSTVLE